MRRQSLDPPKKTDVKWEEYIKAEPGHPPHLGRPLVSKESSKSFRATVAMVCFLMFNLMSKPKKQNYS